MKSFSLRGLFFHLTYKLSRHYLLGFRLTRWLGLVLIFSPLLVLINALPWGLTGLGAIAIFNGIILIALTYANRHPLQPGETASHPGNYLFTGWNIYPHYNVPVIYHPHYLPGNSG